MSFGSQTERGRSCSCHGVTPQPGQKAEARPSADKAQLTTKPQDEPIQLLCLPADAVHGDKSIQVLLDSCVTEPPAQGSGIRVLQDCAYRGAGGLLVTQALGAPGNASGGLVACAAQLDQLAQGIAGLARGKLEPGIPVRGSFASS